MECSSKHLNSLKSHCDKLVQLCQDKEHYNLDDSDHLGFMTLCFLGKQIDHMVAILKLFPHPDMQLISRAMIEGLSQLLWCFQEPERAFLWRGYAWINDWRVSRQMIEEGQEVPPNYLKNIEEFISEKGDLFKINRYKNQPVPEDVDPFHKNWRCGKKLIEITEEVGGEALYNQLYSPYSDWQHWGIASIGQMIKRDESGVTYGDKASSGDLCSSLAVAFQCLYQVMELNNSHHKLGMENKLSKLRDEYILMHQA